MTQREWYNAIDLNYRKCKLIHRDRKQISHCLETWMKEREGSKWLEETFKSDGNTCHHHCGGILWEYTPANAPQIVLFKRVISQ